MKISNEEKKAEAISRMKKLGIFPETIRQFEQESLVSISEPPFGAFYWAEGEDLDRIHQFEERYDGLVYVVIRSFTEYGQMDCYLYVSDHIQEWNEDRDSLDSPGNGVFAYVYNYDDPDLSEFGSIGIEKTPAAGLRRTW